MSLPVARRSRTASVKVEDAARVEHSRGVECRLDPSLQRQLRRIFERLIVIFLGTADAMLAGDSPADGHPHIEDIPQEIEALLVVVLIDREVNVAIAGVAAPQHLRAPLGGNLLHPPQVFPTPSPSPYHFNPVAAPLP